ncbi:MAG: TonB-dependent receptor [Novosphingobium sp.]|nr:TonB-dependent receptor [Novosphingobium sp.]
MPGTGCNLFVRRGALVWSLLAGVSGLACAGPAFAQDDTAQATPAPAASDASDGVIVVTGTRIQGVAPVGSALVQLGQADIASTGLTSTADVLNTVPSILQIGGGNAYAGGQAQQGSTLSSFSFNKSPNIRGFGLGATLSLVNGHRVPYEGGNMLAFDGDNLPAQMLQRIDVVEDGGSALYGADAIAGTVNYILRKPENTAEIYAGYGTNEGDQDSYYVTGILGRKWGGGTDHEGGFIASYQHSYQQAFKASKRPDLYNDDLSPYGGPPSPVFAAPGNVVVGGQYYAIPGGQNGEDLTLSDLGAAGNPNRQNTWTNIDVIPQVKADRFSANMEQNVTDWLRFFADGYYVKRDFFIHGPSSTTANRVSSPIGGPVQVPNSNPFSPCNPSHYAGGIVTGPADLVAACDTGSLGVVYSSVYDIGTPTRTGSSKSWNYGGGMEVRLPYDWSATVTAYAGGYKEPSVTTQTGGAPQPPVGTFNFFCDPREFQCTDDATAAAILAGGTSLVNLVKYTMQDYAVNANGKLFALPAGDVKAAIGAEYYKGRLLNQNNFGGNNLNPRTVKSVYGEVYVPVISPEMSVPVINELELTAAVRYDHYSDAGNTTNPRLGLNWYPVPGLKLFASYGTSFRAPGLADNDPTSQAGYIPGAVQGTQILSSICAACQDSAYSNAFIYQSIGGANRDLKPETSETYSFGADWKPDTIQGLHASVKYWHTSYEGQINAPAYNVGTVSAINGGLYNSQIIYNPALFPQLAANNPVALFGNFPTINQSNPNCSAVFGKNVTTQPLFDAMVQCINAFGGGGVLFGPPSSPSQVLALVNGRRINSGTTIGEGLDFTLDYDFDSGVGSWSVGGIASYLLHWKVSPIAGAPLVEEVNTFGYPQRFKGRAYVRWNNETGFGRLNAAAFVNYANSYKMDATQLPVGVPASYGHIGSYTTVDLTLGFDTGGNHSWLTNDIGITFSVQNLFNTNPPLVVNQSGLAGSALRFDPTFGSPLGRVLQVQVSKKF